MPRPTAASAEAPTAQAETRGGRTLAPSGSREGIRDKEDKDFFLPWGVDSLLRQR